MNEIVEHNATTQEVIIRPLTENELAQQAKDVAELEALRIEKEEKLAARQAILNRLGITEEEAKLLLS